METAMRRAGTPKRAEGEKRYLKSELEFFGATLGQINGVVRSFAREHPGLTHDELVEMTTELWSRPNFERRMAAVSLFESYPDLVLQRDLPLLERLVRESKTWALVDGLAVNVLGGLVVRAPGTSKRLDRWARDDDFWVRRSALLSQLRPLRQGAPFETFARWAEPMLDEKEFFIRKAIGWVLRETGKSRPEEVDAWLAPRTDRASGVTVREAVKYLPGPRRKALLAAYKAGQPAKPTPRVRRYARGARARSSVG